jgi:hypothetical protein
MSSPKCLAADALRDTIRAIERGTDISPEDPSLVELKRILLLKIAAFESEAQAETATQNAIPLPSIPPPDAN